MRTTTETTSFDFLALPVTLIGLLLIWGAIPLDVSKFETMVAGLIFLLVGHAKLISFEISYERSRSSMSDFVKLMLIPLMIFGFAYMLSAAYALAYLVGLV